MRTKIVLWGANEKDEKLLIGIELLEEKNKVNIHTFAADDVTEEFYAQMMNLWRNGNEIPFPEKYITLERDLTVTDSLLPDEIKVERTDIINRAKTEWHFVVLSKRLHETYKTEVEDFKEKISALKQFDSVIWDELKGFWDKVQEQVREKNLFRDHSDSLRKETNEVFETLKGLRKSFDEEFKKTSKENVQNFTDMISRIEEKIEKGLGLQPLFNELKNIQRSFKDAKFTRDDRSKVWSKIDGAFKTVKEKKFGSKEGGGGSSALDRIGRRHKGLESAISRMQSSINRDKKDLKFQNSRIANTDGQLEQQIRQAKTKMVEERINSKEIKLQDMLKTKVDLDRKMDLEKAKEEKRKEAAIVKETEAKLKEKISKEIKEASEQRAENEADLKKAASAIKDSKSKKPVEIIEKVELPTEEITTPPTEEPKEESIVDAISATMGEAIANVVDTAKAVVEIVSDQIEDKIEELTGEEE